MRTDYKTLSSQNWGASWHCDTPSCGRKRTCGGRSATCVFANSGAWQPTATSNSFDRRANSNNSKCWRPLLSPYISYNGLMYCTCDLVCAGMRRCAGSAPRAVSDATPACRLRARTRNDRIAQVLLPATVSRPLSLKCHVIAGDYIFHILVPASTQACAAVRGAGRQDAAICGEF
jgi:hypothetical protein